MPKKRDRVTLTFPARLLADIDRHRKRTGETRSAFIERALRTHYGLKIGNAKSRAYVAGYRRHPESPAEQRRAVAMSLEALS